MKKPLKLLIGSIQLTTFAAIILFSVFFSCTYNTTDVKPNILFIFSDDHAYQAISAYGGRLAEVAPTPRLTGLPKRECCLPAAMLPIPSVHHHGQRS